jgi:hypothetical protein
VAGTTHGAFNELHARLTPRESEIAAASKHRESVLTALKGDFELATFFQSGSWGNGTSVRRYSDVDYFVWLFWEEFREDPWQVLEAVRSTMERRFPKTSVWVDSPAVRINFGFDASERYEVVPAFIEVGANDDIDTFKIPNPNGGWMLASPEGQREITRREDERLDGRLRPLIRFLKLWKYANVVPISSYYLEVLATQCVATMGTIIYSWDLAHVFDRLSESGAADLPNLGRVAGKVSACPSWDRSEVRKAALQASVLADLARERDEAGSTERAFLLFNELFAGQFPAYD